MGAISNRSVEVFKQNLGVGDVEREEPLMLMMALTMPGAAHSLGLGDIHVDSALNEHLAAEIDIVGASALELNDLRAAVANRETFLRYGVDRPAFLSSAVFRLLKTRKAGRCSPSARRVVYRTRGEFPRGPALEQGRAGPPVHAAARSGGFSPPGTAPPNRFVPRTARSTRRLPTYPQRPRWRLPSSRRKRKRRRCNPTRRRKNLIPRRDRGARTMTHVKVGAKATLRGIAWRVGERSEPTCKG